MRSTFSNMNDNKLEDLIDRSFDMLEKAYCPYSKFRVGAVLETREGHIYTGCNVENASFGVSICAERTALVKAVSEGHLEFRRIIISGDTSNYIVPCGACRQFMTEFGVEWDVYMTNRDKEYVVKTVKQLMPDHFVFPK